MLNNILINSEDISLGEKDLIQICYPKKVKILGYLDLKNMKTYKDLFFESSNVILLMPTNSFNNGHWIAIKKINNMILVYNSYGLPPDGSLLFAKEEYIRNNLTHHLTHLLNTAKDDNIKIFYNNKRLQEFEQHINTCGRYCGLFIKLDLNIDQFNKLLMNNKYNPDELVTLMTMHNRISEII
jgi:hypothetical protein